jgi:hypothetical protein
MSLWTMIFLLAAGGILYAAWKHQQDLKAGIVRDQDGNPVRGAGRDQAREEELQREIENLRERVKVLERIATDDGEARRLAEEIDRLRDQ